MKIGTKGKKTATKTTTYWGVVVANTDGTLTTDSELKHSRTAARVCAKYYQDQGFKTAIKRLVTTR